MALLKNLLFLLALILNADLNAQVAVSLLKMNVLYPGIENPLTIVSSDLPDSTLSLVPSIGEIRRIGPEHYTWTICHRDTNFATLTIRNQAVDTLIQVLSFRVNRVPEPTPLLGQKHKSSTMSNGEYSRSRGVAVVLENFDFDLRCDVIYYDVQYVPKESDSIVKRNNGPRYNGEVSEMIDKAKPGDEYHFYNIAYRCGCDPMLRHLSKELNYRIK